METNKTTKTVRKLIPATTLITAWNGITVNDKLTSKNVDSLANKFGLTKAGLIMRIRYLRLHGVKSLKLVERSFRSTDYKGLEALAKQITNSQKAPAVRSENRPVSPNYVVA